MTSIGFATLEIIPSLKGVTEAIEKQLGGKSITVAVDPKIDTRTVQKAGKEAGETVTKEVTAAVRKGDIGKSVGDELASSTKSSAGRNAAKAIVDGIADGVKQELPRGSVARVFVDGLADGVKQGIDRVDIGSSVVTTITTGIKSGNLGATIRDAVVPAITNIGQEIRSSAATWARGIGDALRSGDIQGATTEISNTVQNTTELIADIGSTFGLQLDGVREFGDKAGDYLSTFGKEIQGVVGTASEVKTTFETVGTLLETVLPGKAGIAAAGISKALGSIVIPAALLAFLSDERSKLQYSNGDQVSAIPGINDFTPGKRSTAEILLGPFVGTRIDSALGGGNAPSIPGGGGPGAQRERRGLPPIPEKTLFGTGSFGPGGYTGSMSADMVAGIVHGGEYVIKASSTAGIENLYPGMLDYLNNKGSLPGFKGGGKVQLGNISAPGITTQEQQSMWDVIRGSFPEAILTSATRTVMTEGHPDFHNAGRAIDISGPAMGSVASWIASNYPDSLELIHSPFGHNIKNGKNVGDGTAFYGAGLMAAHQNHVHWALGKTASAPLGKDSKEMMSNLGVGDQAAMAPGAVSMSPEMASNSALSGEPGSKVTLASSISQLPATGLNQLNVKTKVTPKSPERTFDIGGAASAAIGGQLSSAMGLFGVNDSPGFLKAASALVNGIGISDNKTGSDGAGSVAPMSGIGPAVSAATSALGGVVGGGRAPAQQVNYQIRTATVEDAFLAAQRREKERALTGISVY